MQQLKEFMEIFTTGQVPWFGWVFGGIFILFCLFAARNWLGEVFSTKEKKERKRIERIKRWDSVDELPKDAALLRTILQKREEYRLERRTQFLCLKKLDELDTLTERELDNLASLYVIWNEVTDEDLDSALDVLERLADTGSEWGAYNHALMLYQNDMADEAHEEFLALCETDDDALLPLLQNAAYGVHAAWYAGKRMLDEAESDAERLEAYRLLILAALHGDSDAIALYRDPDKRLYEAQRTSNFDAFYSRYTEDEATALRTAVEGLPYGGDECVYYAGHYYYDHAHENDDYPLRAFLLMRLADELGNTQAAFPLGVMYHNQIGTGRNTERAMEYMHKTIEHDSANAHTATLNLGLMLLPTDKAEAIRWFKECAKRMTEKLRLSPEEVKELLPTDEDLTTAKQWKNIATELWKRYQKPDKE